MSAPGRRYGSGEILHGCGAGCRSGIDPDSEIHPQVVEHLPRQRYESRAVILPLAVRVKPESAGLLVGGRVASGQNVKDLGTGPQTLEHALVIRAGQVRHRDVQARELVLRKIA